MGRVNTGAGLGLVTMALTLASAATQAANASLQELFFAACQAPTAALAVRCAQTNGGLGDLSGDSESSLNPSQGLSATAMSQAIGQGRDKQVATVAPDGAGSEVDFGDWSLLWHIRHQRDEWDRAVDLDAQRGFEADTSALEIGAERTLSSALVVGAMAVLERSSLEFTAENPGRNFDPFGDAGSIDGDSVGVLGYVAWQPGDSAFVDISAGYQWETHNIERRSVFQESNRAIPQTLSITSAETDGERLTITVQGGWQRPLGNWQGVFSAGLAYLSAETDGYSERDRSNSGLAMAFSATDRNALTARVGFALRRVVSLKQGVMVPQLQIGYETDVSSDESGYRARYLQDAGANQLALDADASSDSRVSLRLGVHWILPEGWMPFVQLAAIQGNEDYDSLQIAAGLRKRF